jgi:hypothetical protein
MGRIPSRLVDVPGAALAERRSLEFETQGERLRRLLDLRGGEQGLQDRAPFGGALDLPDLSGQVIDVVEGRCHVLAVPAEGAVAPGAHRPPDRVLPVALHAAGHRVMVELDQIDPDLVRLHVAAVDRGRQHMVDVVPFEILDTALVRIGETPTSRASADEQGDHRRRDLGEVRREIGRRHRFQDSRVERQGAGPLPQDLRVRSAWNQNDRKDGTWLDSSAPTGCADVRTT